MVRELARIDSTFLGIEDHGVFTFYFNVTYDNGLGQGIGFYTLDTPKKDGEKFIKRIGTAYGAEMIMRVLDTVGVDSWEKLIRKNIWVIFDKSEDLGWGLSSKPVGIAGTFNNKELLFDDIYKEFSEEFMTH